MARHGGPTLHTPSSGRPGRATKSIDGWNLDALRFGAPYLVDRDGTIYKTFDDSAWIYHLGIKGTNGRYDKASVAIEFANDLGLALYAFGMNAENGVHGAVLRVRLAPLPLLRAEGRGAGGCGDRTDAGHLPPPQVATIVCHSNCRRDKTDLALPDWV